ncbi:TlpA family protein disulfide reductase [Deminuibacter soli]|nr:TlpA disulfide reductase family protein [Deminuibacter soli]
MKNIAILLAVLYCLPASAQDSITRAVVPQTSVKKHVTLDENSIVRDSAGNRYDYDAWHNLYITGKYRMITKRDVPGEYFLVKLSQEELDRRAESMPKPRETPWFTTGAPVDAFKIKDINGHTFSLKDMQGKVVVLNFFFVDCAPCRQEIPDLNTLVSSYSNNSDVVFLAVALDDKYRLKDFLKENPFSYPVAADGRWLTEKTGITSFPTHVVIGKDGNVLFHTAGGGPGVFHWLKKSIIQATGS